MSNMIWTLIYIVATLIILGVIWWAITQLLPLIPLPPPFATIIHVLMVVILVIIVVWVILTLLGSVRLHARTQLEPPLAWWCPSHNAGSFFCTGRS